MLKILCSLVGVVILVIVAFPSLFVAKKIYDSSNNDYFLTALGFVVVFFLSFRLLIYSIKFFEEK